MKVVISGANGFVGRHLVDHLIEHTDWDIVKIVSDSSQIAADLKLKAKIRKRLHSVVCDLRMPIRISSGKQLLNPDFIIHAASNANVSESLVTPSSHIFNNVFLTVHMLEYAREQGCKHFIQISTGEVYGPTEFNPKREWESIVPHSPYAASKAAQEAIAISYNKSYGIPLTITNTQNVFGQYQSWDKFIPSIVKNIYQGKTVELHGLKEVPITRNWIHARSHAAGILTVLNYGKPENENKPMLGRVNIAGDLPLTHLQLAQNIRRIMGKKLKYKFTGDQNLRPGHAGRYALDNSLLRHHWTPRDFQYDLKATVEYYVAKLEAQR